MTCGGESGEGHVCACFVSDVSKVRRIMSNSNSNTATAAAGKLLSQYLATFLLELQTKVCDNFTIMEKAVPYDFCVSVPSTYHTYLV